MPYVNEELRWSINYKNVSKQILRKKTGHTLTGKKPQEIGQLGNNHRKQKTGQLGNTHRKLKTGQLGNNHRKLKTGQLGNNHRK